MRLSVERGVVVHGTVVQARVELGGLQSAGRGIIRVARQITRVAAPHQISAAVAVLGPPPVPVEERIEGVAQQPAIVKLAVKAKDSDGSHRRFGTVRALPASRARIVRNETLRRLLAP